MANTLLSLLTFLPLAGALVLLILPENEKSKVRWVAL
jgi:NADH:ubiquinone oxidoreductase subunit 4 (subunit M)